jgi:hypothetical protein
MKSFILVLSIFALLALQGCKEEENKQINSIEPTLADVQEESGVVLDVIFNFTNDQLVRMDNLIATEDLAGSMVEADDVYRWTGEKHIWEQVVDQPPFYAHYYREQQYFTAKGGTVVKKAKHSTYMTGIWLVEGTYGFVDGDPYGVEFKYLLQGDWSGINTDVQVFTGNGQYKKDNYLVFNGEDAMLNFDVLLNVNELSFNRANLSSVTLTGDMSVEMAPYMATISCDGSSIASVVITVDGVEQASYDYDLTNLAGKTIGFPLN